MLEAGKRLNSPTSKDVISTEHLVDLYALISESNRLYRVERFSNEFFVILRFNEFSELRCTDIVFQENYISLKTFAKLKPTLHRAGAEKFI